MSRFWNNVTTAVAKLFSEDCYKVITLFLLPVLPAVSSLIAYYSNWEFPWFGWASFLILSILFGLILAVQLSTHRKSKKKGAQEGMSVLTRCLYCIGRTSKTNVFTKSVKNMTKSTIFDTKKYPRPKIALSKTDPFLEQGHRHKCSPQKIIIK